MFIHGSYTNRNGDTIEVKILTGNDSTTTLEIGAEGSGVYFNDDPVEIDDETNDPFDVFLTQSATVTLLTDRHIPELFALSALSAKVNISCAGKVVFAGYIEPQTYSQDFNEVYDELQLNCIDALSALQYTQYKGVTNSDNYDTAKAEAEQANFRTLIGNIIGGVGDSLIIGTEKKAQVLYDRSVETDLTPTTDIFSATSISELLFFDDDVDSIWTLQDVLSEVLRYYNLHIRQTGNRFFIFDWSTAKSNALASDRWYEIYPSTQYVSDCTTATTTAISTAIVEDCDTQISLEESFNQIKLPCSRKTVDELAVSPLDEDTLVAPFPKKVPYCREYLAHADDEDDGIADRYNDIRNKLISATGGAYRQDTDNMAIYDYYLQVFQNAKWQLHGYNVNIDPTKDVYGQLGNSTHDIMDMVCVAPRKLTGDLDNIVPAIVRISKSEAKHARTETFKSWKDETTYLVIPVRGTDWKRDSQEETPSSHFDYMGKRVETIAQHGLMRCTSSTAGGSLSPVDDDTTNYIVIEGKMLLQQAAHVSYDYVKNNGWQTIGASGSDEELRNKLIAARFGQELPDNFKYKSLAASWLNYDDDEKNCMRIIEYLDEDGNTRTTPNPYESTAQFFLPPLSGMKMLQFTYNEDHSDWDTVDKVAILDCRLKVGDKYCVEIFEDYTDAYGNKRTRSTMQWLTESECPRYTVEDSDGVTRTYVKNTFSIGIDPEPGDYIIGEEHEIANTLLATDNIDAEGTAIPIKASDHLSGKVQFEIVGPVNGTWNEVYRRHPTLFRHTKFYDHRFSILDYCSAIYIKDFTIGIYSDNGKTTDGNDKDLVYFSDEDAAYRNVKECDDMKINSALSSAECIALGVVNQICLSNPSLSDGTPLAAVYNTREHVSAKPEEFYVDAYYNEMHTPKILLTQNLQDPGAQLSLFDTYTHPALPGKTFYILGASRNLTDGSLKLKLREI